VSEGFDFSRVFLSISELFLAGKRYAMISLKIMLADLLRNYKFTTTLKMNQLEFGLAISIKLMNKHWVQIERRNP
jgi:hypothetical protein